MVHPTSLSQTACLNLSGFVNFDQCLRLSVAFDGGCFFSCTGSRQHMRYILLSGVSSVCRALSDARIRDHN